MFCIIHFSDENDTTPPGGPTCRTTDIYHWILIEDLELSYEPPVKFIPVMFKGFCSCLNIGWHYLGWRKWMMQYFGRRIKQWMMLEYFCCGIKTMDYAGIVWLRHKRKWTMLEYLGRGLKKRWCWNILFVNFRFINKLVMDGFHREFDISKYDKQRHVFKERRLLNSVWECTLLRIVLVGQKGILFSRDITESKYYSLYHWLAVIYLFFIFYAS